MIGHRHKTTTISWHSDSNIQRYTFKGKSLIGHHTSEEGNFPSKVLVLNRNNYQRISSDTNSYFSEERDTSTLPLRLKVHTGRTMRPKPLVWLHLLPSTTQEEAHHAQQHAGHLTTFSTFAWHLLLCSLAVFKGVVEPQLFVCVSSAENDQQLIEFYAQYQGVPLLHRQFFLPSNSQAQLWEEYQLTQTWIRSRCNKEAESFLLSAQQDPPLVTSPLTARCQRLSFATIAQTLGLEKDTSVALSFPLLASFALHQRYPFLPILSSQGHKTKQYPWKHPLTRQVAAAAAITLLTMQTGKVVFSGIEGLKQQQKIDALHHALEKKAASPDTTRPNMPIGLHTATLLILATEAQHPSVVFLEQTLQALKIPAEHIVRVRLDAAPPLFSEEDNSLFYQQMGENLLPEKPISTSVTLPLADQEVNLRDAVPLRISVWLQEAPDNTTLQKINERWRKKNIALQLRPGDTQQQGWTLPATERNPAAKQSGSPTLFIEGYYQETVDKP